MAAVRVAGAVTAFGRMRASHVIKPAIGGGRFGIKLAFIKAQGHWLGIHAQTAGLYIGITRLHTLVKSQQADALLLGVKVAGDAADRLARLNGFFLFQLKIKTLAAVPKITDWLDWTHNRLGRSGQIAQTKKCQQCGGGD